LDGRPQCCSVRERARALRPRYAKRQLEMLRQLQEQDPSTFALMMRGNEAVPEGVDPVAEGAAVIARQLERWSTYEAALQMAPEAKRVADRATWEPWLRRYRERIAAELAGAPEGEAAAAAARVAAMNAVNPKFILRNYLAQRVIQADDASMDEACKMPKNATRQGLSDAHWTDSGFPFTFWFGRGRSCARCTRCSPARSTSTPSWRTTALTGSGPRAPATLCSAAPPERVCHS